MCAGGDASFNTVSLPFGVAPIERAMASGGILAGRAMRYALADSWIRVGYRIIIRSSLRAPNRSLAWRVNAPGLTFEIRGV